MLKLSAKLKINWKQCLLEYEPKLKKPQILPIILGSFLSKNRHSTTSTRSHVKSILLNSKAWTLAAAAAKKIKFFGAAFISGLFTKKPKE